MLGREIWIAGIGILLLGFLLGVLITVLRTRRSRRPAARLERFDTGAAYVDSTGRILHANSLLYENLDYAKRDGFLTDLTSIVFPADFSTVSIALERIAAHRSNLEQLSVRLKTPTGDLLPASATVSIEQVTPNSEQILLLVALRPSDFPERNEREALQTITQELSTASAIQPAASLVLENLLPLSGAESAILWLRENGAYHIAASAGKAAGLEMALPARSATCRCIQQLNTGQADAPVDVAQCEVLSKLLPASEPVFSTLAVPLRSGKRPVGVLDVTLTAGEKFSASQRELLQSVGAQISAAVERLRLTESEREQHRLAEALQQAGAAFSETLDFEAVLDRLLETIPTLVPCDAANVMLVRGDWASVVRTRGYDAVSEETDESMSQARFRISETPSLRQMAQTGRPLLMADVNREPTWVKGPPLPYHAWLGAPIFAQNRIVAFINLDKTEPDFYRQRHAELINTFSGQAALAIENAWLASEASRRIERERQIGTVNRAISASLDLPNLLDKAASLTTQLLEGQTGVIALLTDTEQLGDPLLYQASPALTPLLNPRELSLIFYYLSRSGSLLLSDLTTPPALEPAQDSHPEANERWIELLSRWKEAGVHSALFSTLPGGEQRLGLLGVFLTDDERRFDERDLLALEAVGRQVGTTIQNVHLYEQQRERLRALEALRETLTEITGERRLPELLGGLVRRVVHLLHATGGEVCLADPESPQLEVIVSYRMEVDRTGDTIPIGSGAVGLVASTQAPLIIDRVARLEDRAPQFPDTGSQAVLAMPLTTADQLTGVILITDSSPTRVFTQEDVRLLHLFSQQATLAIENSRLLQTAQRQAEESETLRQTGSAVAATLEPDEFIARILEQLARVVPYDSASVQIVSGSDSQIVGGRGFIDSSEVVGLRLPLDNANPGTRIIQEARPLIIEDVQELYTAFTLPPHNHIHGWMGVPMLIQGRVIGLLALDARTPGRFTEHHARLVAAFADQVAIALENVRLYQRAIQSADRLGTLYETGQEIAASLMPDDVYEAIRRAVSRLMPADIVMIGWFDADKKRYETLYMATQLHQRVRNNEPVEQGSLIKRIIKGQAMRISRMEPHPTSSLRLHPASQTGPLIQSLLAVPLRLGGQVVGLLATHAQKPDAYTPDDQRVLELLAAQAAIALDNSRMFREAQQMAFTDPLTRLYNRRQFFQVGRTEFERSTRYDRPLTILMIDLDHFKLTNDQYGHNIGDQVLSGLADILSSALRKVDIVARYGGEEFVILLPETSGESAHEVAERLRMSVELSSLPTDKGPLNITISLGVGVCTSKCSRLETLIDWADRALYRAKHNGRNRVEMYYEE